MSQPIKPNLGFVNETTITPPKIYTNRIYTNNLTLAGSSLPESGQVLISDAKGNATWQDLPVNTANVITVVCPFTCGQDTSEMTLYVTQVGNCLKIIGKGLFPTHPSLTFSIDLQPLVDLGYSFDLFQFPGNNLKFPVGTYRYLRTDELTEIGNVSTMASEGYFITFELTSPTSAIITSYFVIDCILFLD
jgi:hypothetical protein